MKRILVLSLTAFLSVVLAYGFTDAAGPCADCHTMHYSQNGIVPANADLGGPFGALLVANGCIGCHGKGLGSNIENDQIPQVLHTDVVDLAGGNFGYITGIKAVDADDSVAVLNSDAVGHNVASISNAEDIATMFPPPGDEFNQTGITSGTFTCAGAFGCHGDRTVADELVAMRGAHHISDTVLKFGTLDESGQGGTVGLSYRYLLGVHGGEDIDWQATVGLTDHNEYKGATLRGTESTISSPGGNTISGLCAECHGNFHGTGTDDIGTASPWLRHPTDIVLPSDTTKEYYLYNGGTGTNNDYSYDDPAVPNDGAPVARADTLNNANYTTAKGTVTPGSTDSIVMCLSCHQAHASKNADILRWNYEDIQVGAGGNERCMICHTTKQAP